MFCRVGFFFATARSLFTAKNWGAKCMTDFADTQCSSVAVKIAMPLRFQRHRSSGTKAVLRELDAVTASVYERNVRSVCFEQFEWR